MGKGELSVELIGANFVLYYLVTSVHICPGSFILSVFVEKLAYVVGEYPYDPFSSASLAASVLVRPYVFDTTIWDVSLGCRAYFLA